jgi:hypothetical protein
MTTPPLGRRIITWQIIIPPLCQNNRRSIFNVMKTH